MVRRQPVRQINKAFASQAVLTDRLPSLPVGMRKQPLIPGTPLFSLFNIRFAGEPLRDTTGKPCVHHGHQ